MRLADRLLSTVQSHDGLFKYFHSTPRSSQTPEVSEMVELGSVQSSIFSNHVISMFLKQVLRANTGKHRVRCGVFKAPVETNTSTQALSFRPPTDSTIDAVDLS